MATRSASSASAMSRCAIDRAVRLGRAIRARRRCSVRAACLASGGGLLLDAVDALAEPAAGEVLRRPGAVSLDPDSGERTVRVPEGDLAHLLRREPLAPQMPAARSVRVVDEDLQPVLPLSGPQERDGVADVTDPLQR